MRSRLVPPSGLLTLAGVFAGTSLLSAATSVLSYHNDLSSSGVNSTEKILTPSNLTTSTFAKLYSTAVDAQVYAQPLYVPGVNVTSGPQAGKHNLVIVATENDTVYAIDADSGAIVWQTSLLTTGLAGATSITAIPSSDTGTTLINPLIGITGTPVIDGTTKMLFVCASTKQIINNATTTPSYVYGMYQIDITNGNATTNANIVNSNLFADTVYNGSTYTFRTNNDPTAAQDPFVFGTGNGEITVNGTKRVYFNGFKELDRCGLILTGGTIYAAFASHSDSSPYHGWLLGFNESNLAIMAVSNLTPNGGLGGIWNSGGTPVVDSNGYIYVMTGNGTFDGNNTAGVTGLNAQGMPVNGDYGDSIVRLALDSTTTQGNQNINGWGLKVLDYFAPYNNQSLSSNDSDVGSGGVVLLPPSAGNTAHANLIVGAGKQGNIYLCDTSSLGHYGTTDNVVQSQVAIAACFDTPAFFNGVLYYAANSDHGKAFTVSDAAMAMTPVSTSDTISSPGPTPSISANGTSNALMWVIGYNGGSSSFLRAYSLANFASTEIWSSTKASGNRDALGAGTKFSVPTVADGHVFVGTASALVTYGLSSVAPLFTSGAPPASGTVGAAYNFNFTATGAPYPAFSVTGGSLPPGLTLATSGGLSGTPTTPGLYSGTVTASNGVNPAATQNFSITIYNTYSNWTSQEGLSGNNALPTSVNSADGITNLMKYALGLNPFTIYNPANANLPQVQIQKFSGTPYLTLTFTGGATDVTYTVQASSDLKNWSPLYTSSGAPPPGTITVQDTQATSASSMRYLRLQVSQ